MSGVFRLCVSSGCLLDRPFDEALAECAASGYSEVEVVALGPGKHVGLSDVTAAGLIGRLRVHGLGLAAVYCDPLNWISPEAWAKGWDACRRAVDLAAEAGGDAGGLVVFTPVMFPREKVEHARIGEDCVRLAEYVAGRPVRIALENHHGFPMCGADDYEKVFARIPDIGPGARVGIAVDTGHFVPSAVDTPAFIRRWKHRIIHVHLKDQIAKQSVELGTGHARLPDTIAALHEIGYRGRLCVEMELADTTQIPEGLRAARSYCHQFLGVR